MIGVFDSGFGGLTVLKELLKELPEYDYMYLGDNARAPYGNKTDEEIYDYTSQAVDFLLARGCKLIIIACHTASAKALRKIQADVKGKVLGVVVPIIEGAVELSRGQKLGIIGTTATIESGVYGKELKKIRSDLEIIEQACPRLAGALENGWVSNPENSQILKEYLSPLRAKSIDTLVLACTHYPLLENEIADFFGKKVKIVNPARTIAEKLADYLARHEEIDSTLSKDGQITFYTTDDEKKFKELGSKFLGSEIEAVERVVL